MVKLKDCVCSDITPDVSFNSTSPSHIPTFAITVSAATKVYETIPVALVVNTIVPLITKVPSGFQTFHLPVEYVVSFVKLLAVPSLFL